LRFKFTSDERDSFGSRHFYIYYPDILIWEQFFFY
jgi:hypothetical protein